ncbi:TolC family protein [Salinimicrobium sp. MT39]|uniref:TolC family protein n=1 Tax=Salinimicrobium profundisediminis TaxID=2994553 RepID=A0A9X3CY13_9FLAO|nr:TolC family protein [Salinimicrobium profundisediminis]MCX2837510.1 TolC family protein [Salinimicrobium profundisediminis]
MQRKWIGVSAFFIFLMGLLPTPGSAQQLEPQLMELIEKGLNKNHELNQNEIEAQQAVIDQKLARSVFLPKITVNGNYTRLDDDLRFDSDTETLLLGTQKLLIKEAVGLPFNAGFPEGLPVKEVPAIQQKNILKSSVDVDWVLFSGFQASGALKASKHKEASIHFAGSALQDKIALKIIETYDQLALVNASEKVLKTSEEYLAQQNLYVNKAIENGLATPIERKKIELAKQQLIGKQLEFEQNRTLLLEVLQQLTGVDTEQLEMLTPQLVPFNVVKEEPVEKRDEVKALEEAEKASLSKAKMERNNFIPKLALKGHYELLEDDLSLLDPRWYVGVGVKWNLFDGNQANLKSKQSKFEALKYREKLKEAEEMIALSITKAELNLAAARQNTQIVQKEIDLAAETYEMVNKQYRNDLASVSDVLDALRDLEQAGFHLQESIFKERRAMIDLRHAKGQLEY